MCGFLLAVTATLGLQDGSVHVAPTGDDAADGTAQRPFRTLTRARDAVRALPEKALRRILLHAGDYVDCALLLDSRDSGLTLEGAAPDSSELIGGIRLEGWSPEADGAWSAPLPPSRFGPESTIRMLLMDGRFSPRARFPESGTLEHRSEFAPKWRSTTGGGWERPPTREELSTLRIRPDDLPPSFSARNAEVTVFHMWDESCVGVARLDRSEGVLGLASPCGHPPGAFGVRRFVVWNIREGLTRAGQWLHDRERGRIVYRPLPGQDMSSVRAFVPVTTAVLRLQGTARSPIRHVTIRNLRISVSDVPLRAGGFAAASFDGAIQIENAEDIVLESLQVSRVGGHGIKAAGVAHRLRVAACDVELCGAGGIYVGGSDAELAENHVRRVGLSFPSAVGIYSGGPDSRGCRVVRNEVHDCPYTGINYGGDSHLLEGNYVYDCMKVLHDGAAIYLFGARACTLRRNIARDVADTGGYGSSAFYLDERSEGCLLEGNLSWRVPRPVHNHMAKKNVLRNNVFVVAGDGRLSFPKSSEVVLERNIVYAFGTLRIENIDAVARWSGNIFYSGVGRIEGIPMKEYAPGTATDGVRGDTLTQDPGFRDLDKMDLEFKAGSPAPSRGIVPLDLGRSGRPRPVATDSPPDPDDP